MIDESELKRRLLAGRYVPPAGPVGCSEAEIKALENSFSISFPSRYAAFLKSFGRSIGTFLEDVDFSIDKLDRINRLGRSLLQERESDPSELPPDAFVCSMRHGQQFFYFLAGREEPDPKLYYVAEWDPLPSRPKCSFWEWIEDELLASEQLREGWQSDR